MTFAGYILGFPNDTTQSILRDIEIIQRELPLDFLEFFILTPLPGSEDHKKLWQQGTWMDPDMNKYDVNHVAAEHPRMSKEELQQAWWLAWHTYYSPAHMVTLLRRAAASGLPLADMVFDLLWFRTGFACSRVHPLEAGYFRLKFRHDRRPGMPKERPLGFYLRYARELLATHLGIVGLIGRLGLECLRIKLDPQASRLSRPVADAGDGRGTRRARSVRGHQRRPSCRRPQAWRRNPAGGRRRVMSRRPPVPCFYPGFMLAASDAGSVGSPVTCRRLVGNRLDVPPSIEIITPCS